MRIVFALMMSMLALPVLAKDRLNFSDCQHVLTIHDKTCVVTHGYSCSNRGSVANGRKEFVNGVLSREALTDALGYDVQHLSIKADKEKNLFLNEIKKDREIARYTKTDGTIVENAKQVYFAFMGHPEAYRVVEKTEYLQTPKETVFLGYSSNGYSIKLKREFGYGDADALMRFGEAEASGAFLPKLNIWLPFSIRSRWSGDPWSELDVTPVQILQEGDSEFRATVTQQHCERVL